MGTITFDTHGFVKRLTAAGMPEAQAEVLADEQTNLIENMECWLSPSGFSPPW